MMLSPSQLAQLMTLAPPMVRFLGLDVIRHDEDSVTVRMPYREVVTSLGGGIHAGALIGLVQTTALLSVVNRYDQELQPGGAWPYLLSSQETYLSAAHYDVLAVSRPAPRQGRVVVVETDVRTVDGTVVPGHPVARCASRFVVVAPEG